MNLEVHQLGKTAQQGASIFVLVSPHCRGHQDTLWHQLFTRVLGMQLGFSCWYAHA